MYSNYQGKGKIYYFLRIQNEVWLAKLYFYTYTKNGFYQGWRALQSVALCTSW